MTLCVREVLQLIKLSLCCHGMKHNIQLSHTLTSNMYITLCLMMSTILDRSERDCECGYVERGGCSHYFSMETNMTIYHLAYSKIDDSISLTLESMGHPHTQ